VYLGVEVALRVALESDRVAGVDQPVQHLLRRVELYRA